MKKLLSGLLLFFVVLLIISLASRAFYKEKPAETTPTPIPTIAPTATPEPTEAPLDPSVFTDTDSLLVVANKKHKLPDGYAPSDLAYPEVLTRGSYLTLRYEAAVALEDMFKAAKEDGVNLAMGSGYRSEETQRGLYNGYVASYGAATADTISSRPGYSDHQTGLACDMVQGAGNANGCDYNQGFATTAEGIWLKDNAHKYGFIMRYPEGKSEITGYSYEPWHFRYIGIDYATKIYEAGPNETFEEYFGVDGGDYAQ